MSNQFRPILSLGVIAGGALAACRFITPAGAYPAAGADTLGVTRTPALASGDRVLVDVMGTAAVEAGAAITAGAEVEVLADGRITPKASGKARGKALEAASGAGKVIEVLLYAY
jgi:predicted RecA/RadA family phage recombinase